MSASESTLRKRRSGSRQRTARSPNKEKKRDDTKEAQVLGKTPDGTVFVIPQTHDVLSGLFDPRLPKSHIDLLILGLLGSQTLLFITLPSSISRWFFLAVFAFWRIGYDAGLGWILRQQSENRYIVRLVKRYGWMDAQRQPKICAWVKDQLDIKMGKESGYDFDKVPLEYNVWLFFRHLADIVLINDFLSYCWFAWSWLHFPPDQSVFMHILRWVAGWSLVLFNVWVKVDAHRVVKDYAWYWGDCFFLQLQDLVFDGVFSLAPHPMYSVGYAGYYGLSLIVGSTLVLFVSMAAHAGQFAFLTYFENPHIERTYGKKKPYAMRTRLPTNNDDLPPLELPDAQINAGRDPSVSSADSYDMLASDHAVSDSEDPDAVINQPTPQMKPRSDSVFSADQPASSRRRPQTLHDLHNRYFIKDVIVFRNFDIFRARDLGFALALIYSLLATMVLPFFSAKHYLVFAFANALAWRLFHSFGLGLALRAQSRSKWIVRHFLKTYYYESDEGQNAVIEAFRNWKSIYNWSLCMVYASFAGLAFQCWHVPSDWTVGLVVLRHTGGLALIALHIWTATATFEALGEFGWLYADFFLSDYPKELLYTGIYRFLNNPERIMGGAAFFGLALLSGSKLVGFLAVVSVFSHFWFLNYVENPHMEKLYGQAIRKDAGVTRTLKDVTSKNIDRAPPEVRKAVRELQGTFEKVTEEASEVVNDFLRQAAPLLSEYVAESRVILQQSRERLLITRIANDLDDCDAQQYSLSLEVPSSPSSSTASPSLPRVRYGEAIKLSWQAPAGHSRRDWIGVYRVGGNRSKLVTQISSRGKWIGVFNAEWDGDQYVPSRRRPSSTREGDVEMRTGSVVFEGAKLPKTSGLYELRYHHDGKHNVLAIAGPVEIYVEKPSDLESWSSVHDTLLRVVSSCLGNNLASVPRSSLSPADKAKAPLDDRLDDDDFVIWDAEVAARISEAVKESCGVDLSIEVIKADCNVSKLANRIMEYRRVVLSGWTAKSASAVSDR